MYVMARSFCAKAVGRDSRVAAVKLKYSWSYYFFILLWLRGINTHPLNKANSAAGSGSH